MNQNQHTAIAELVAEGMEFETAKMHVYAVSTEWMTRGDIVKAVYDRINNERVTKDAARGLAVAYHAFHDERSRGSAVSIAVWGQMLMEAQEKTGIEMVTRDLLESIVERAKGRL